MKYAFCILFFGCQLFFPFDSFSDYEICFKNGRTLLVERYWEKEDGQIKASYRGGVIGLDKNYVTEIRHVVPPLRTPLPSGPAQPLPPAAGISPTKMEPAGDAEKLEKIFLDEKNRLTSDLEEAGASFREAKSKNDKAKKKEQWEDLLRLREELAKLKSEAMKSNHGKLPVWWQEPANESANEAN